MQVSTAVPSWYWEDAREAHSGRICVKQVRGDCLEQFYEALCKVIGQAQEARKDGLQVLVVRMNKNKKFQKEQLEAEGYQEFVEFYKDPLKN